MGVNCVPFFPCVQSVVAWQYYRWMWHTSTVLAPASHVLYYEELQVSDPHDDSDARNNWYRIPSFNIKEAIVFGRDSFCPQKCIAVALSLCRCYR